MKSFVELYTRLDRTNSTNAKLSAMREYFRKAEPACAAWAVNILSGRRQKRLLGPAQLREWLAESVGLPDWLVEQSYAHVGDLAETAALLHHTVKAASQDGSQYASVEVGLSAWMERLLLLRNLEEGEKRQWIQAQWQQSPLAEGFVKTKLLTGALRVGVSQTLVVKALAQEYDLPTAVIQRRLMGDWQPTAANYLDLIGPDDGRHDVSQPYPFCLAYPLEKDPATLGGAELWLAEWKWDGIRAQLIKRQGNIFLWSRGEELVMHSFPEIVQAAEALPDGVVIDGEILGWTFASDADAQQEMDEVCGKPLPFNQLQRRLGRKKVGPKLLGEVPVILQAYDQLESDGISMCGRPLLERRSGLQKTLSYAVSPHLRLSPALQGSWEYLAGLRHSSRERGVEGFMLKRLDSVYQAGRVKGDWWKWKVDPYTVDAVLLYAQAGHGRRSNLYTDYTFAVWEGEQLVPFAKAYSGLADSEIVELDRWIRKHTKERFGPVRSVEPVQVFELAFEGIALSKRHKSGVAVRFPRIQRWRKDKLVEQADSLTLVKSLVADNAL